MKKSISIITLGCPKNQVDSEYLASSLDETRFHIVHEKIDADIVIINTCGFIRDAQQQSIDTILSFLEEKKVGNIEQVIVFGCMVERFKEELIAELPEVDAWFGVHQIKEMAQYLNGFQHEAEQRKHQYLTTPTHYAYLKIAEGCDRTCSFCAIPKIRGKHVSKPIETILQEAQYLTLNGVKELIVVAQDTTYYGLDLYGKRMLSTLLDLLARETDAQWIRLHYTYPTGFPLDILEVMQRHSKICRYIDIPFQHVNDTILKNMKRHHTKADIVQLLHTIRREIPDVFIRSAFIVGFPGEGEQEFEELRDFLKKHNIERVGFFAYSDEEGTDASLLHGKVHHRTIIKRLQKLYNLTEKQMKQTNKRFLNMVIDTMIDFVFDDHAEGRTQYDSPDIDNIVVIHNVNGKIKSGQIVKVKIIDYTSNELIGKLCIE